MAAWLYSRKNGAYPEDMRQLVNWKDFALESGFRTSPKDPWGNDFELEIVDGKPVIRLVGTDGHRLAVAERELNGEKSPEAETKVIIPKKAALEMRHLLEEDDTEPLIGFTRNTLTFRKSGLVLTSRLMEGAYPNYEQVVPKDNPKKITMNREEFEGALRRVSLLSRDKASGLGGLIGSARA